MSTSPLHNPIQRRLARLALVLAGWLLTFGARAQSTANDLTNAWSGTINQSTLVVSGLPSNGRVAQLLSDCTASAGATIAVVESSGQPSANQAVLSSSQRLRVTAASGAQQFYALQPTGAALSVETLASTTQTTSVLTNRLLQVSGNSELHITSGSNPLKGTFIDVQGDNVWLYFEGVKPSKFSRQLLRQLTVNGQRVQLDTTARLAQYLQGCILISQPGTFQPLQAFTASAFGGSSMLFDLYTYYQAAQLGSYNDAIRSFKLRKGYMATFAENEDGTGTSRVFIAPDKDLEISALPTALAGKASFVRVMPWRWVSKKGWCGGTYLMSDSIHAQWNYNWNNNRESTLDQEYVPIRQNGGWPSYSRTNFKKNITHLLGFNEPDSRQQSNLSPQQAMLMWPGLLQSGLRVGSPACTDGGASWLYKFIDKCDSANYRVDYVAIHFYRGCQTAQQFYNFLKALHDRTQRPVWITEFNNGANWTSSSGCPKPTYAEEASKIKSFITMLDTTRFVERYSIYQWVEDTRKMYATDTVLTSLTQAGLVYRNKNSPLAYNPNLKTMATNNAVPVAFNPGNLAVTRYGSSTWTGATNSTIPVTIDEYVPTSGSLYGAGQLVRSLPIPTGNQGANFGYVGSALKGNVDGSLSASPDRSYLSLAGFNLATGTTNANGGSAPRVVAILDADGNTDTRTGFSDGNGQPLRCAAVTDSATAYIAYGNNNLGLKHASLPTTATASPATRTGTTIFPTISLRKMAVYEDELYFTNTTVGNAKVMKLNGLPSKAATPAALPGIPTVASGGSTPGGFVMFDVNPNVAGFDLLYYTDDASSSVLNKYTFNGSTWTLRGTYTMSGLNDNLLRDLTGTLVRGIPTLYAVSYTSIVKLEDKAVRYTLSNSNFTAAPSITATELVDNATSSKAAFRGIAFTPGTRDSLYVRRNQTLDFPAIGDKNTNSPDFYAGGTSSAGLEVAYTSSNLNVATVTNGLIDVVGAGTVTITASQVGNYKYLPAPAVARTFNVTSAASARTAATPLATKTAASPADIELFPNPAHGEVSLVLPAALHAAPLQITVLNVLGQAVLQRTLPGGAGQRTLPLEGLAKGVYIVRIESAGGSTSKRLLHE